MAHFYGTVQGNRGIGTRMGTANSGLTTYAASYAGAIRVGVFVDEKTGRDMFRVSQEKWHGSGVFEPLVEGFLGEETRTTQVTKAILEK